MLQRVSKMGFSKELTYSARRDLEHCSQTGFFLTVIVMQLFTLVTHRTSRESLLQHGMRNYALTGSLLCSLILALMYCYIPILNIVLHTCPLKFIWCIIALPFGVFMVAYDETRNFIIRHSSENSWIARETY
ncbi:hypothetical protein CEXT_170081 [Caerostris extrusa]|uniref:Cation-transporting P-type ATPase C-terminal domain-containing protein n=1 Tax=Caerostris extrusa TaxID=172846 RepID=A0AAV4NNA5_CAEEX|nr:hypothetical protein CEXT_170081 [Caerostris extrusa]